MKAERFFSVHYDMRHNPKVDMLRDMGGGIVALGRWLALMSILYDSDGLVDVNSKPVRRYLEKELETDDLDGFLAQCAECKLVDADMLSMGHVVSKGVCDELEYYRQKSEAGKKSGEVRRGKRTGK